MQEVNTRVENKEQLFALLNDNLEVIKSYGVSQLGVFGSFVRNEMTEESDVDFLVEFFPEKKTYKNFIRLTYFLEDLIGREAEVVTIRGLSKYIGPKILASAEYIFRD